ncbi:MAG TPA: hypothetical protein VF940_23960 [Streptosporangiaceae bacterium]
MNARPREVCLGWHFAPILADPGPAPPRPAPGPADRLDQGWVQAQARIAHIAGRPARAGLTAGAAVAALSGVAWLAGLTGQGLGGFGTLAGAAAMAGCARSAWRGRRRLAAVLADERQRVETARAAYSRLLEAQQREHASDYRTWQRRRAVFDRQPSWFAVGLPAGIDRVDVAGGTLAGWSALVTTIAAPQLSGGGEVTVVDLTEAAVAGELIRLAQRAGLRPLVWALPADLHRLDLGAGLEARALADVLALAASAAADRPGGRAGDSVAADAAVDCALLERVLSALGPDPGIASVTAALRMLGDVGDPRADVGSGLLTTGQLQQIGRLFRHGAAERMVLERAFVLESRLRALNALGTGEPPVPGTLTRLRVAALDRRAGVIGNRVLGTYVVAALTHMLRRAEPGEPWAHVIFLLGAERLAGDALDRLADACEVSRTGLVLAFRSIPASVRERLGRGNAMIAFMRLGNGDDARAASELIGTEHRFVVGQLTDTVGMSVTDTLADSYTSTVGTSDSVADSVTAARSSGGSRGRGRGRQGLGPFGDFNSSSSRDSNYSRSGSESISLTEGINSGTSWGISLSRALGENASFAHTAQRSRELLVEPDELQRLPPSAMIVSYPAPDARIVTLADANPALMTLPSASLADRPLTTAW